ncbi:hypothetical protein [Methanorbis furvi]|uniref:Uncharacterized protein n=1 Tax=Methanorbis furvi TaxID=3028299 RepID=A0AAE4MBG8_9EURY|nr:hypothetical protein [Methanocorpusculaceae archaeon Ag1]
MDPLTVLFAYFSLWVNTLNYTLGAAVIALAIVYFTKSLPVVQRILIPAVIGIIVSIIGTGILIPASVLPQLGYPLCLFALGSGCAVSYLAVASLTKRNLGWILIIICSHLAAYCVMLSSAFVSLVGESIFGFFIGAAIFSAIICSIATWCVLHWNPAWTPWWISGDREGRNAFLRKIRRKKNT